MVAAGVFWMCNALRGIGDGLEFRLGLKILEKQEPMMEVTELGEIS